ncbi:MAG: sodium/proline symporter PutP [Lachnospiraceae bacterium]|nr:sodium/proline symporter PutP [Lachnospiraceae bacterium]
MSTGWIVLAFVIYLSVMVLVGVYSLKQNNSSEDYFLGGRRLGGLVAALSAQASDMSGWLLMGLPGSIYALGTGQIWIAVGLFIGTVLNWLFIASRLRRYTIRANNAVTLPQYLENRFHDDKRGLLLVSSLAIMIFFLVYTASALAAGGQLFTTVFGIDYKLSLTIGAIVILTYTLLGGFTAVCDTDFIQGTVMLIALLAVPIVALAMMGGDMSAATSVDPNYLNPMYDGGNKITLVSILSQLAWGLGYCGMPHILVRFMAVKSDKELNKAKGIGIAWVALSLAFACVIGIVGRAYIAQDLVAEGTQERVFMYMIIKAFTEDVRIPLIGGIFLCGILAAIMSTADSQLLVTASSVTEDLYMGFFRQKQSDKKMVWFSRIVVVIVAVIAYFIALDPSSSIMGLVSDAWAGLGAAFGPTVLLSLYWKRTNTKGAFAGIVVGALTVIFWDYLPLFGGQTAGAVTGVYSLLIGFFLSLIAVVVASLATEEPSSEMVKEFEDVRSGRDI